jgi:glutathione S-transferase
MAADRKVVFFHSPQTRSTGVLTLLEELEADYELRPLNMRAGEQREAAYLSVNPMGKVPAIEHNGALVTEQAAVYMYLAELYPEKDLAPAIGDPLRGPYLRWMVFYGSCFEPALIDKSQQHPPTPSSLSPYGDYDTVLKAVNAQLERGPYLLGDRFTAADVLWASALAWTTLFELVPATPVIKAYIARVTSRPSFERASATDGKLIAARHKE